VKERYLVEDSVGESSSDETTCLDEPVFFTSMLYLKVGLSLPPDVKITSVDCTRHLVTS